MSENAEERLGAEMRRALVDFFERFFLWCALFRPVSGSRGMRAETELTRFGKVRCGLRRTGVRGQAMGNSEGRLVSVSRRGGCGTPPDTEEERRRFRPHCPLPDPSSLAKRSVTLRRGKEEYDRPASAKIDLGPGGACGGKRRRTAQTMVVSPDGTCVPCAKKDLEGVKGRDGKPAQGRNVNVGMVALYDSVRREDGRPVIPPSSRKYVIGATADEIWSRLRATALAAGYGCGFANRTGVRGWAIGNSVWRRFLPYCPLPDA